MKKAENVGRVLKMEAVFCVLFRMMVFNDRGCFDIGDRSWGVTFR